MPQGFGSGRSPCAGEGEGHPRHPPQKLRQHGVGGRVAQSCGRGGNGAVLTRGGRPGAGSWLGSWMAASLRPLRLGMPRAPAAALRVVRRQGRGSAGESELGLQRRWVWPPEPQPQLEPGAGRRRERSGGSGCEGGVRFAGRPGQPGRSSRRHLLALLTANQRRPGRRRVRRRGGGACGAAGGSGGALPRLRQDPERLPGRFLPSSPGARAARAWRGGAHREPAGGTARTRGGDPHSSRSAAHHSSAVPEVVIWSPRVVPRFELRLSSLLPLSLGDLTAE
jgi:hypothetical protein